MEVFNKSSKGLAKCLYWIAGMAIILMMLLTCVDVVLRLGVTVYHRNQLGFLSGVRPIAGTYELVCFLGSVAVSFAMAHTSVEKGHVAVSLMVRLLSDRTQGIIASITNLFSIVFFILLSWQSVMYAHSLRSSGEVSLTLQLPFYPFVYGIGFASAAVCLVLMTDFLGSLAKVSSR